jgi:soluble lytic murein transglycosylase-like protein
MRSGSFWANRVGAVAIAAGLLCAMPAQADDYVYLQRQDGVRTYTQVRPLNGNYTKVLVRGRPTASASCMGLTKVSMAQRAKQYEPIIHKVSSKHGVPAQLVSAVMRVESCYERKAVSRAGARGLMQLMPGTARQLGVRDSFDPEQNIDGGVRYLKAMLERFNHNIDLGLAAYNAGPEAVAAYKGVPPYPETQSYITRIRKLYKQA